MLESRLTPVLGVFLVGLIIVILHIHTTKMKEISKNMLKLSYGIKQKQFVRAYSYNMRLQHGDKDR